MARVQLDPSCIEGDHYVHEDAYIALYLAAVAVRDAFQDATPQPL